MQHASCGKHCWQQQQRQRWQQQWLRPLDDGKVNLLGRRRVSAYLHRYVCVHVCISVGVCVCA